MKRKTLHICAGIGMMLLIHIANSKTDVEDIKLDLWQELIGKLLRIDKSPDEICLHISIPTRNVTAQLRYGSNTPDGNYISNNLKKEWIGSYVGIIQTDVIHKPIIIRRVKMVKNTGW